jgi:hypothetical protein
MPHVSLAAKHPNKSVPRNARPKSHHELGSISQLPVRNARSITLEKAESYLSADHGIE